MSNFAIIRITIDQDKGMKIAIADVFPNTQHWWCLWHLLKKILDKLGAINNIMILAICCVVLFVIHKALQSSRKLGIP